MAERETDDRALRREQPIEIANEFAFVHVRKVGTGTVECLEIESPRRGKLIRLDPFQLEALACQDVETFPRVERPADPEPGASGRSGEWKGTA